MRETVNDRFYTIPQNCPENYLPTQVLSWYFTAIHRYTHSVRYGVSGAESPKRKKTVNLKFFSSDWIFSCTQPTVLKHWMDSTRENHPLSWSIDGLTAEANGTALLWLFDNNSYGTETYTHLMQYSKPKCLCGEHVRKINNMCQRRQYLWKWREFWYSIYSH